MKIRKLAFNSKLQTFQILTNGVQMHILCPSYFITTVLVEFSLKGMKIFKNIQYFMETLDGFGIFLSGNYMDVKTDKNRMFLSKHNPLLGIFFTELLKITISTFK